MKKERMNMYEMMVKDSRTFKPLSKSFFLDAPTNEKEVKAVISKKIVNSLSHDMEEFAYFMTRSILEGLLDDRR
ncbi:hypothetical protein [Lacrimispora indolis]|uniref:hypothetical protein n=1 Tax=Lacrimispora indolis TaxID=69825 RepID=UPI000423E97B|nr:hypothetical protein [[Clostridium] methoxybenzovorans]